MNQERDRMNRPMSFPIALAMLVSSACSTRGTLDVHSPPIREVSDSRFDSYLQEMTKQEHFIGAVLIMRDGKVVHAKGYGAASQNGANRVDTKFHVGSITKQFTAAAVMQLVERGELKLEDPVTRYLPDEYRSPKWDVVTLHHLLSHTSGITDYAVARDYYRVVKGFCSDDTVSGMVKEAMRKDLEFVPGSKFSYSNLGYTLLGFVIEHRAKKSYDDYIADNILDPMGMTSSRIHAVGHVSAEDEAEGFRWSDAGGVHVPDDVVSLPVTAPDGGLVTTLGDFAKWAGVFTDDEPTVLSRESIQLMSSQKIAIGAGGPLDSMGYGLYVGDRLIGHGGLIVGFSSQFIFDRDTRSLIVVFSNNVSTNPQRIATGLLTILLTPGS